MKIRFYNAKILVGDDTLSLIDGEVVVENDTIIYVGEKTSHREKFDREIDVKNNILMPSFTNCHTHSAMTLFRGICDDSMLQTWLFENIVPLEKHLTKEDVYWGVKLANLEYLASGITMIDDMYYSVDSTAKAVLEDGLKARILSGSLGPSSGEKYEKFDVLKKISLSSNRIKTGCCIHSIYTTTEEDLDSAVAFSKKENVGIGMHLCETLKEVGDCSVKNNELTPPQYIEQFGILDRPCTFYHCVHMDKDDISILADYNANVVTCPSSNIKLASGIAPIYALQNSGINIAIGTDGASSNNSLDMFKEMFLVSTLSKVSIYDPTAITASIVLKMATENGAKALGFEKVGKIETGWKADLILVDTSKPHFQPKNNLVSHLVYSAKSSDVYFTMCDGSILYENGKYPNVKDVKKIYAKCEQIISRLKKEKENN